MALQGSDELKKTEEIIEFSSLIVKPGKNEPAWLQFFDNRTDIDPSTKKKLFNTNNYYEKAPFVLSKENSERSDKLSRDDIENEMNKIKQELKKHKPKPIIVCNDCGKQFSSNEPYTERDVHKGMKQCHPVWNMNVTNATDETKNDDNNNEYNPAIFIHFSKHLLDQVVGLSKFFGKMKQLNEITLIESKLNDNSIENGVCFALPLFSVMPCLFYIYMAEVTSYNLEIWYNVLQSTNINNLIDDSKSNDDSKQNENSNCNKNEIENEIWHTAPAYTFELDLDEVNVIGLGCMHSQFQQKPSLSKENQRILTGLERRLDNHLKKFSNYLDTLTKNENNSFKDMFETTQFFARLSTRSPKDSIQITKEILEKYPNRIDRIKMIVEKLKCENASQILNLFYQSQRIFGDLMNFSKFSKYCAFAHDSMNIVIRPYFKNLEPKMEFRLFIKDNKLNAISQYLCYDQFEILQNVDFICKIRKKIVSFYNDDNVSKTLATVYKNYVLDVFVTADLKNIFIIEINPFGAHSSSGSCLYEWINDQAILTKFDNDNSPYFRIAKKMD